MLLQPLGDGLELGVHLRQLVAHLADLGRRTNSRDHVLADLGGRTVEEALEAGLDPRRVWRSVCDAYDVPPARR